jgi:hypothetical protein
MPGPRVYTIEEVDRLLPKLEAVFARIDRLRGEQREQHLRISALEMIWGARLREADNPDRGELEHHLAAMQRCQRSYERCTKSIERLGGHVKSVDPALVDFYGVREGRLVFWCWTRGEPRIEHWHHVDEGFAARQKV